MRNVSQRLLWFLLTKLKSEGPRMKCTGNWRGLERGEVRGTERSGERRVLDVLIAIFLL